MTVSTSHGRRPPRAATGVLLLVATGAGAVALLGLSGSPLAVSLGTAVNGSTVLCLGVLMVVTAGGLRSRPYQVLAGAASLAQGLGNLVTAVVVVATGVVPAFPSAGDSIGLLGAPLGAAAVLLLPRPAGPTSRAVRLVPDTLAVGAAAALLVWRTAFAGHGADPGSTTAAAVSVASQLSVVSLLVHTAVISLDPAVFVIAAGEAIFAGGSLYSSLAAMDGDASATWQQSTVLALGTAVMAWGMLRVRPTSGNTGSTAQARVEARASLVTVCLLAAIAATVALGPGRRLDTVALLLIVVLLAAVGARELVLQVQRVRQIGALSRAAHTDPLTGLGNRRALRQAIGALGTASGPAAVVVLDLDGFKAVNDRLGHATGDALLVEVAARLGGAVPAGARAFRLGGDEFAVLAPGTADQAASSAVGLRDAVRAAAVAVPGVAQVHLSASCGVVEVSRDTAGGADPMLAVTEASTAMHAAKRAGRDRTVRYTGEIAAADRRAALVEERLRSALERDEVRVHLQPIVDLATWQVLGFEALARWTDAELGPVGPAEFVPVAERAGLVVALGSAALRQGLAGLVACDGVRRGLTVSVNASPVELRSPRYVEDLRRALLEHAVPADLLVVEVTEAVLVADDDPALRSLLHLEALGVRIAVDDFGTGYSSLAYLVRLPVHALKLDRSLVAAVEDPRTVAVVRAVVGMSDALGLAVVAEGVEHPEQAAVLAELGVHRGQGWLWSPAVPPERAAALVDRPLGPAREAAPERP